VILRKISVAGSVLWLICVAGCSSRIGVQPKLLQRGQVQVGVGQSAQQPAATAGDDGAAVNVSPTMAVYGGSGLATVVILALVIRSLVKFRRGLKVLVGGIESAGGQAVKSQVAKASREAGVGDFVHGQVRRCVR